MNRSATSLLVGGVSDGGLAYVAIGTERATVAVGPELVVRSDRWERAESGAFLGLSTLLGTTTETGVELSTVEPTQWGVVVVTLQP